MQLFLRIIKTSWQGFWRNGWLSLVAIFIMVQVLLLVGIFLSLNVGVGQAIRAINNQIDLAVFFKEYVPAADITDFQARIDNIENVAFALEVTGASDEVIKTETTKMLDLVGLKSKAKSFPHELSGGEAQRVAIARAILRSLSTTA